jgi:hypothetical protein
VFVVRGGRAVRGEDVAPPGDGRQDLGGQVSRVLAQALSSEDAERAGLRADDVLADRRRCPSVLGGPDGWPSARNAVVQRYGRVGALLVVGYEARWRSMEGKPGRPNPAPLEVLLDHFGELGVDELEDLLARLDDDGRTGGDGDDEASTVRRRLHATYAVAGRDGTTAAHRAYMEALERFMGLARRRLAS